MRRRIIVWSVAAFVLLLMGSPGLPALATLYEGFVAGQSSGAVLFSLANALGSQVSGDVKSAKVPAPDCQRPTARSRAE